MGNSGQAGNRGLTDLEILQMTHALNSKILNLQVGMAVTWAAVIGMAVYLFH